MKNLLVLATIALLSVSCGRRIQQNTIVGTPGANGIDSSSEKVTIVQICPNNNSGNTTYLESLLKVEKTSGEIEYMAFFDATKKRLVSLTSNANYVTTDDRNLPFHINGMGEIVCNAL